MKNLKHYLLLPVLLAGCCNENSTAPKEHILLPLKSQRFNDMILMGYMSKVKIENHSYLLYERGSGGVFMLHSESCPCRK